MACPAADYGGGDGPLARPDGVAVLSIGAGHRGTRWLLPKLLPDG